MNATTNSTLGAPPNFDRLARAYRWMEFASFGPWLQLCRYAFFDSLKDCRRAVIIGDGDGRFTARLLRRNPMIQIEAIDASPAMLRALLRRAGADAGRIRTICADARSWQPAVPPYDLVVTHFFLDCLTSDEIQSLAATLRTNLMPGAQWLVSEFAVPNGLYGRFFAQPLIHALYWAFGQLTGLKAHKLPDYRKALHQSGFKLHRHQSRLGGLLVSELWSIRTQ